MRGSWAGILAFTDVDVEVDLDLLARAVAPILDDSMVGVVTGLVMPDRLDTAQCGRRGGIENGRLLHKTA